MGRSESRQRTGITATRWTPDELATITAAAQRLNISIGQFVRDAALHRAEQRPKAHADVARAVVAELARGKDSLDCWPDLALYRDWAESTVAEVLHRHQLGQQPGGGHRG